MKRVAFKIFAGFSLLLGSQLSAYHGEDRDPFSIDAYGIALANQKISGDSSCCGKKHHRRHHHDENPRGFEYEFDHRAGRRHNRFNDDCSGLQALTGSTVQFGEAHIGLTYHYLCSGCCEEYLIGGGYTYTRLQFPANPFFDQQNYNTATADLGFYWGCICDWEIRGLTRFNLDTDEPNPSHYLWFDFTLWGRLQHKKNIGINVGALIFTGMNVNRGYPIFGIDWRPSEMFEINLVYPTNMSLAWYITPAFKASVGGRLIYSRHRIRQQDKFKHFNTCDSSSEFFDESHAHQYFSNGDPFIVPIYKNFPPKNFPMYLNPRWFARAVWEYRAWGIEGALDYTCGIVNLNVHAGWSFWNRLTIGSDSFNHKQTFKLDPTPYVGANFLIRF